ncbi:MAG TPA: hypothetical protein VEU74_12155 [Gemmatimonadales bacterium]|nr:hypothetical protein [Gemmatimonadales bacterium]
MGDPLAGYHVGWQDEREPEDPLAGYTPDWQKKLAATPAAVAPPPETPSPTAAAAPAPTSPRFPDIAPRFDRFGEPINDAGRDVEEAQGARPETAHELNLEHLSPRTRALGFGVGLGRGALSVLSFLPQAVRAVFSDLTPEEARNPATLTAALRYGPHAVEYVRQVAAQPTAAERGQPGTGPDAFIAGLNPLPLLGRVGMRDPEAVGEVGGMVIGGKIAAGAEGQFFASKEVARGGRPGAGPDPFATLGLDRRTATADDVQAAFRDAAQKSHPDVAPEDRVARGGSADPIVAAQQFTAASAARDAALEELGRGRPAQGPREQPVGMPDKPQTGVGTEEVQYRAQQAKGGRPAEPEPATSNAGQAGASTPAQAAPVPPTPGRPDLEGFMGTGPETITPEDLAATQVIGREEAPDYDAIAGEARELQFVRNRTPEQNARLADLRAQLKAAPPLEPPIPLAQSAAAPGVQEAQAATAAAKMLDRERRKAQVPVEEERRTPAAEPFVSRETRQTEAPEAPRGPIATPGAPPPQPAPSEEVLREPTEEPVEPEPAPAPAPLQPAARGEPAGEPTGPAQGAGGERPAPSPRAERGAVSGRGPSEPRPGAAPERPVQPAAARESEPVREQPAGPGPGARVARSRPGPDEAGPASRGERGNGRGVAYRITPDDRIGQGSLAVKARDNVTAVELLKDLTRENRQATPDEQKALVRYVGWGALPQAFNLAHPQWGGLATELKGLLTPDEYERARASTPNAHYTSPAVIQGIYRALDHMGFAGGRLLEPSAGVGHFLGLGPKDAHWTAVEQEPLAAGVLKQLYPNADVKVGGFEEQHLPDDFYHGAITNVPFGNYPVHDPLYNRHAWPIHNYFVVKALDKVRPGGVVAVVTSHYAMDAASHQPWRQHVADRADLIGAIRLPSTAFEENAGTKVTTDILFLRKRLEGEPVGGERWLKAQADRQGRPFTLNEYFEAHPDMALGEHALIRGQYGPNEYSLTPKEGDLGTQLDEAIAKLPGGALTTSEPQPTDQATGRAPVGETGYRLEEGKLTLNGEPVTGTKGKPIATLVRIRDAAREVLRTQAEDESDVEQQKARGLLNRQYDAFVKRHGPLNKTVRVGTGLRRPNLEMFQADPDVSLLAALEDVDEDTDAYKKAAIFTERVIQKQPPVRPETPDGALLAVLNERGKVDLQRIADLMGKPPEAMREDLRGLVFDDPATDALETADNYLSGNVRQKLELARQAAKLDKKYAENVSALEKVIPEDVPPSQIHAAPGVPWIPPEDVSDFIHAVLGAPSYGQRARVSYLPAEAAWSVTAPYETANSVAARKEWGTERAPAIRLIEDALNQIATTVYDPDPADSKKRVVNERETIAARELQQKLKDRFATWVWEEDPARATRLHRVYNDTFNNMRPARYDGTHLTLPGSSGAIKLLPHQKDAIWRGLQQRKLGLFQVVGAGKTYEMAAIAMEAKRLGLGHKAMHVVPNHLVGQFQRDFLKLYPAARILVADDKSFARAGAAARKEFVARVATGNWDSVVITHSSFARIPMSKDFERDFLQEQLEQYQEAALEAKESRNRDLTKLIEKGKKRLEARIKQIENREAKDDLLPFEQLGVDMLFADEAQAYKNLYFMTKMRNVPGAGQLTQRSMDLYLKARYLDQSNGRLVLATGTPISNTISEMYTMQRYLQPEMLRERGIEHFDAWAAAFGEARTALELAPSGAGYRMATRFAYFQNVGELAQMFRAMADVKTAEDLKLPVPKLRGGKPETVVVPGTPELKQYIESLVERAAAIKGRKVDPSVDNMLKVTHDGRFAALDMRLVAPTLEEAPQNKLASVADQTHKLWLDTKGERGTQLIFINAVKPGFAKLDVYGELRAKLQARGIPANEIAVVHDADTDAKKEVLFRNVREGKVRVMLGSIQKMGMGTNVQDRLYALHHMDAPWRPADIEQGDGRILRRGNRNPEVRILHYVTEGSFDSYIWQMQERKARAIDQMMKAQAATRTIEDVDGRALTFAEIKAISTGNPLVMEKAQVDAEVQRLSRLASSFRDRQFQIRQDLTLVPERIDAGKHQVAQAEADARKLEDVKGDAFKVQVGDQTITKRAEAGKKILELGQRVQAGATSDYQLVRVGKFAGLELMFGRQLGKGLELALQGEGYYHTLLPETAEGVAAALDYLPKRVDVDRKNASDRVAGLERQRTDLERLKDEKWPQQAEFDRLTARQVALNTQLDLDKSEANEVREEAEIPDAGTADAEDGPSIVDIEDALAHEAETPEGEEPAAMPATMARSLRDHLVNALDLSHAEADRLSDADIARMAVKAGKLDDVTHRDLLEQVRGWVAESGAGLSTRELDDLAVEAEIRKAGEMGGPRILAEKAPQGLGFVSNYFMPPSWAMKRLVDAKNPVTAAAAQTALRIVRAGQNATLAMAKYADERESRRKEVNARLDPKEKAQVRDLLDKYADAATLPKGTPPKIRAAFEEKRAGWIRDKKLMGQTERGLLRGRSQAILEAALTEWPEGTPAPDFETTPVNRRRLLDAADEAGITANPMTREGWDELHQKLKDEGLRVAKPAYMDSPDLRRIYQYIRGEGGIAAYLPHVFTGDWVVRAGAQTARFVDRLDAIDYARKLVEAGQVTEDVHVVRDGYVPDWGTYLSRTRWLALREQLARELEAESATVSKALGEARVRIEPRKRFFAHAQPRRTTLETFEQDLDKLEQTYNWRLARYLAFTPFRKAALELAEGLPYDGGWRDWSEAHIAGVQGVPGELTTSINNTLTHLTRGIGGPIPLQAGAGMWQRMVSFWLGGYNPVWPVLHTLQYMTNIPAAFKENGHQWAWKGLRELVKGAPESKAAIDAAGVRFQHPMYAVSEFLPRGVGGKGESWWHPMWMFNTALDTMRSAAVLAKYYEARSRGLPAPDAQAEATNFLRDTYFDFSMANAPRVMRNPLGRTLGQLQLYGLNQLLFAEDVFRRGSNRQRASFAFHTWAWMGAAALMATWPLFALNWALGKTGWFRDRNGRKDTPWGALWDHLGPAQATQTLAFTKYGVLGLFGINLSEHVGMMGPSGWRMPVPISLLKKAIDAATSTDPRQQEAGKRALAPIVVARLMKAWEAAHEGKIRSGTGKITQDTVTTGDIARLATGFQSVPQAERQEQIDREQSAIADYKRARTEWLERVKDAYTKGGWPAASPILDEARRDSVYLTGKDVRDYLKRAEQGEAERRTARTPKALRPQLGLPRR